MLNPAELLLAFTWRDALDLAFLFLIFYGGLRLVQGTRAAPILLAIAFVAGVAFVAQFLELVAIATVLKYFLEYVILILVVVFHQELRRLLLRMGQRLLPHGRREATESALSELGQAVERLARARVGALLILEGELDVLETCSDAGRPVECELRADTIVALCVPHPANVAHDGAILLRELKLARAGVICPLSANVPDPRFGTRHRGAIGVTEETDAFVIVLSEERGEIRVVQSGRVSEPVTSDRLVAMVQEWLETPAQRSADEKEARVAAENLARGKPNVPRMVEEGGASERA